MNQLMILNKHTEELFGEGDINFIISSNNIVLAEQTAHRVGSALQEQEFENDICDVYTWRSGKKEQISSGELYADIIDGKMETVIMCANAPRMKHLVDTIQRLESSRLFTKKIKIWIDEADASIQLWKKHERIIEFSKVQMVTLVSATFTSIFKRYGRLFVLGYEDTHPSCYRCLRDCTKVEINVVGTPLDYVRHVVDLHGLAKPGVCAFIPGDNTQVSHNEISSYLYEQGFVVVIINGDRKEILVPGKPPVDLKPYISSDDELNITLSKLYYENDWNQMPFALTGHYCVGRGVTFQCLPSNPPDKPHQGLLFTEGIISPIADASTAYQLMARLFGNIGDHPAYAPCTIYSTHSMFTKVGKQESCAIHLAKMIRETYSDHGGEVGMDEVKKAMNAATNLTKRHRLFVNQDDAIEFIKHTFGSRVNKRGPVAPKELLVHGENPNLDSVIARWWGINTKSKYRMVPVVEGWVVYWI
jgi:hypothetical protein